MYAGAETNLPPADLARHHFRLCTRTKLRAPVNVASANAKVRAHVRLKCGDGDDGLAKPGTRETRDSAAYTSRSSMKIDASDAVYLRLGPPLRRVSLRTCSIAYSRVAIGEEQTQCELSGQRDLWAR